VLVAEPADYAAASEVMWCGSLSHNGLTGLGRTGDFSVHQFGHELSARFDAAHGASLTTMWASWARYVYTTKPARFAQYARNVWGVDECDDEAALLLGIEKTVAYFKEIGMPTSFTELGIGVQGDDVIDELAESCVFFGKRKVGVFQPLDKADVMAIYQAANR